MKKQFLHLYMSFHQGLGWTLPCTGTGTKQGCSHRYVGTDGPQPHTSLKLMHAGIYVTHRLKLMDMHMLALMNEKRSRWDSSPPHSLDWNTEMRVSIWLKLATRWTCSEWGSLPMALRVFISTLPTPMAKIWMPTCLAWAATSSTVSCGPPISHNHSNSWDVQFCRSCSLFLREGSLHGVLDGQTGHGPGGKVLHVPHRLLHFGLIGVVIEGELRLDHAAILEQTNPCRIRANREELNHVDDESFDLLIVVGTDASGAVDDKDKIQWDGLARVLCDERHGGTLWLIDFKT